ncbi:MAG TPA: ATP-dependent DNA ligase [Burkholderiales bacterium]|nr:ATP-dependent DNA ligase [Burkholderiales bacterium]
MAATASRREKIEAFAALLRRLEPGELEIVIPFLSGEPRQGRLSVPFAALRSAQAPGGESRLTVQDVDRAFESLKGMRGKGVAQRRATALRELFVRATPSEQDFLARLIIGELRQGALEGVMLDAVAAAADVPAADVRRAATFAGALAPVARAALEAGTAGLRHFSVQVMRPVMPMLAQPAADAQAAMAACGTALVEWKLDGARVQVHKEGAQVKVFTRSLNEVTAALPEVVAAALAAPAQSLILDGEAIALRPDGSPHPFQDTMRRFGRKKDDADTRDGLPLSAFFFDCLLADGHPLVDAPLEARRAALERAVLPENVTPAVRAATGEQAAAFYEDALRRGHEGVMVKSLGSPYEAGRRGGTWLKVKRAHTLDLVVLAVEWGSGRRKGWLSNLHLGARDPAGGGFVMLGKTFKGLTDAMLEWQTREFLARETARDEWIVRVRPELVVEIAFNDIQKSPHYPCGMALRFARVKRYRPDKAATQADTIDTVRRLFESQAGR